MNNFWKIFFLIDIFFEFSISSFTYLMYVNFGRFCGIFLEPTRRTRHPLAASAKIQFFLKFFKNFEKI